MSPNDGCARHRLNDRKQQTDKMEAQIEQHTSNGSDEIFRFMNDKLSK